MCMADGACKFQFQTTENNGGTGSRTIAPEKNCPPTLTLTLILTQTLNLIGVNFPWEQLSRHRRHQNIYLREQQFFKYSLSEAEQINIAIHIFILVFFLFLGHYFFQLIWFFRDRIYKQIYSVNFCIQSEHRKLRTRKNSVFGHFSRSHRFIYSFNVIRSMIDFGGFFSRFCLKIFPCGNFFAMFLCVIKIF